MGAFTIPFIPSDIPVGLVGYWKFNNDATDSSGKGYNLTAGGSPTYTANGNYWKDAYCTNTSSGKYFTKTRNADIDLIGAFTISLWVKANSGSSIYFLDKKGSTTGYGVLCDPAIRLIYNGAYLLTGPSISLGKWTHIVCTYDQTTARMYIDGNSLRPYINPISYTIF